MSYQITTSDHSAHVPRAFFMKCLRAAKSWVKENGVEFPVVMTINTDTGVGVNHVAVGLAVRWPRPSCSCGSEDGGWDCMCFESWSDACEPEWITVSCKDKDTMVSEMETGLESSMNGKGQTHN